MDSAVAVYPPLVFIDDMAPFVLDEVPNVPGRYRLTLHREHFADTTTTFAEYGDESDSIGWAWVARQLLQEYAAGHLGNVAINHRPGAMILYGPRGALSWMGALLHDVYHRPARLAMVIERAQYAEMEAATGWQLFYCGPPEKRAESLRAELGQLWTHAERRRLSEGAPDSAADDLPPGEDERYT
jgi:hypothetical protein